MNKKDCFINRFKKLSVIILSTIVIFSIISLSNTVTGQASITYTINENDSITYNTMVLASITDNTTTDEVDTTNNTYLSSDINLTTEDADYIMDNVKCIIDKYSISDNIAISFTDFSTNTYIAFNDNREFLGASTTKLPLALFICNKLENKELSLTDTIAYSSVDYEDGAGVMLNSYEGQLFTVETLLENMLIHSDNIATNMFYRHFGYSTTKEAIGDLVGIEINTNENIITSKQMNEFVRFLFNNKNKPYYSEVVSLLCQTYFHDRLDKYLPYNIVSHKIGNYNGNTHDVGIVFLDKPYALSVYTDNVENAEEFIASLSKEIYDFYLTL